jgi:hypothetical protein
MPDPSDSFQDADTYASLAAAEAAPRARYRAIRCEAAGTLAVLVPGAVTKTVPFKAGETQRLECVGVVAAGSSGCVPVTLFK